MIICICSNMMSQSILLEENALENITQSEQVAEHINDSIQDIEKAKQSNKIEHATNYMKLNPMSYITIIWSIMDISDILYDLFTNTIYKYMTFLLFIVRIIMLCFWGICILYIYKFIEQLLGVANQKEAILILIMIGLLVLFIIVVYWIFFKFLSHNKDFKAKDDFINMLYSVSAKTKTLILQKVDLRTFGGDDEILNKIKIPIDNINKIIFDTIIPYVNNQLPILITNILELFSNFYLALEKLFKVDYVPTWISIIISIYQMIIIGSMKIIDIYNLIIKLRYYYNIISIILSAIYIGTIMSTLIFMKDGCQNPKEYVMSIIDFSEKLLSYGVYEAQNQIAIEMNEKFIAERAKWEYILLVVVVFTFFVSALFYILLLQDLDIIIKTLLGTVDVMSFFSMVFKIPIYIDNILSYRYLLTYVIYILFIFSILNMTKDIFIQFTNMIQMGEYMSKMLGSFFEITNINLDFNKYDSLSNNVDSITFVNIDCGYSEEMNILENVNLTISSGKIIFVYGVSGAGKTTLFNSIQGKIYVNRGAIMLSNGFNSQNLLSIYPYERNLIVASVPQILKFDTKNCTLSEYLIKSGQDVLDKDMIDMLIKLKLVNNIEEAKVFLERSMGLDGSVFSGGQKSRIYLAAALLKNSFITLIDESLDNLDSQTTSDILSFLCGSEYTANHVPIIISHKIPLIIDILLSIQSQEIFKNIYIWYINDGVVSEYNVNELLNKGEMNNLLSSITGEKLSIDDYEFIKYDNVINKEGN